MLPVPRARHEWKVRRSQDSCRPEGMYSCNRLEGAPHAFLQKQADAIFEDLVNRQEFPCCYDCKYISRLLECQKHSPNCGTPTASRRLSKVGLYLLRPEDLKSELCGVRLGVAEPFSVLVFEYAQGGIFWNNAAEK
eukprot:GFKZ01001580.1.p1 GENE.GFKZ01001580.1~~GFKZ01001580.1.p1  ORF type:complete len:136 (-),score=5.74 GFKZ01001580.1:1312-1719(-)